MVARAPVGARRRLGWQRAGLAISSTLVGLLTVEFALRALGAAPSEVPQPADEDRRRVPVRLNTLGLREEWDVVPPRRADETRVVMLGDSFVFGEAVHREEAMPAVLERELTVQMPGRPFRVFNLGVCDNNTSQEAARYRALQPTLQPDVLVLVAYLNDFTRENPAYTLRDIYDAGGTPGFFSRHSYLVGNIYARLRLRVMRARSIAWYRSSTLANLDGEFAPMGEEILRLRDFARARGARFVLVFFPWLYSLDAYPLDEVHSHLRSFARHHDIDLLDLLDVFRHHGDEALRVSPANEHPNAQAHRMAAQAIARFLLPTLDVEGGRQPGRALRGTQPDTRPRIGWDAR